MDAAPSPLVALELGLAHRSQYLCSLMRKVAGSPGGVQRQREFIQSLQVCPEVDKDLVFSLLLVNKDRGEDERGGLTKVSPLSCAGQWHLGAESKLSWTPPQIPQL